MLCGKQVLTICGLEVKINSAAVNNIYTMTSFSLDNVLMGMENMTHSISLPWFELWMN